MTNLRFLVDENTTHTVGDQLLRREPDIVLLTVGDEQAPTLGTPGNASAEKTLANKGE